MPYKEVERQQNLFNQSHRVHITPLVIHGLGGGHTHTHTHTHTHIRTEVILRNQARAGLRPARAWFKKYNTFNNSWISPYHRAVNIASPDLQFSFIREEDEGVYRCIVTNDDGSVISDNATVHVYGECSVASNLVISHV